MRSLNFFDWLAIILLVIGGLNWGLLGLLNVNVISVVFGDMTLISRIIYVLVGIAAIYLGAISTSLAKQGK